MLEQNHLYLYLHSKDIDFLNKILEGFDNLASVTTINNQAGLVRINLTPGTRLDVLQILQNFPRPFTICNH